MYFIGLQGKRNQLPSVQFLYPTYIIKLWAVSDVPLFATLKPFLSTSSSFPRVLPWSKRLETTTGAGSSLLTLFPYTSLLSQDCHHTASLPKGLTTSTEWKIAHSGSYPGSHALLALWKLILVTPFGLGASIQALTPYHGSLNSFAPECLSV